jgi:PAS domain-containing protein
LGGEPAFELIGIDITERVGFQVQLQTKHEQLMALYQEVASTEEELRCQYHELEKAQLETEHAEKRYKLAAEGSRDIIWEWDEKQNRVYMTNRFYEVLGYNEMDFEKEIITIKAVHFIKAGDELFINYNGSWNDSKRVWFEIE